MLNVSINQYQARKWPPHIGIETGTGDYGSNSSTLTNRLRRIPHTCNQIHVTHRAWRETVVTKNLFWKPWFRCKFDPFCKQGKFRCHCSERAMAPQLPWFTKKNEFNACKDFMARRLTLVKKNTNFSYNRFMLSPRDEPFHEKTNIMDSA